jgi:uncharacterized protein (TIGR02452 family)
VVAFSSEPRRKRRTWPAARRSTPACARSPALSILTAPAPNAGLALARDPTLGAQIGQALYVRASKVLAVAAARGHRCLVLGAWGCGAFRNDAAQVADAFSRALGEARFRDAFDRVVFAVYDPGGRTLGAFERVFGPVRM